MGLSSFANYELGEAFFNLTDRMVVRNGIPFPKIGDFDFVSKSWRKLADKPDKTQEEIQELDDTYKAEIVDLADSCILYMGIKLNNKEYKFTFDEYKKFYLQNMAEKSNISTEDYPTLLKKIQTQFYKIANHGEKNGDNLIDNMDFAAYIYALDLKSVYDENDKFTGFTLNGKITPMNYAIAYKELKDDEDNFISFKLRHAYKNLFS